MKDPATMKFVILALFILPTVAFSQKQLVLLDELSFNSAFEKTVLTDHFLNRKTDLFLLFMANGGLLNESAVAASKQKVTSFLTTYDNDKFAAKKNDKKVKTLYADIHEKFLTKYEDKNHFEDIFHRGYYNCVSATALYGIIFQELGIPFAIKESPQHVYLVAYPDQERLIVETTTPNSNFVLSVNPQLKESFVRMLRDNKLITQSEFNSSSTNALFDKYYFKDQSNITLVQLIGIQYANEGLYLLGEKQYAKAFGQFEKAYLFYPNERHGYLSMIAGAQAVNNRKNFDQNIATLLGKLSRYTSYGITEEMIKGDFQNGIQELLFDKGEKEQLAAFYDTLTSFVTDVAFKEELSFQYNYEIGRFFYNQARYKDAISYFEKAVGLKPNHLQATSIFISTASYTLRNKSNEEILTSLEEYKEKHPALLQNNIFNEMLSLTYLKEFEQGYEANDPVRGEKYRVMFESFIKEHSDLQLDHYAIGKSYSAGVVYFFKKGQQSKARVLISQGMKVSPENHELKMRSRMLN